MVVLNANLLNESIKGINSAKFLLKVFIEHVEREDIAECLLGLVG